MVTVTPFLLPLSLSLSLSLSLCLSLARALARSQLFFHDPPKTWLCLVLMQAALMTVLVCLIYSTAEYQGYTLLLLLNLAVCADIIAAQDDMLGQVKALKLVNNVPVKIVDEDDGLGEGAGGAGGGRRILSTEELVDRARQVYDATRRERRERRAKAAATLGGEVPGAGAGANAGGSAADEDEAEDRLLDEMWESASFHANPFVTPA